MKGAQKIKDIKGMKDVFENFNSYRHVLERSKPILEGQFGFKRLLQNTVERQQTFSRTLGISSDIVQKEMYSF